MAVKRRRRPARRKVAARSKSEEPSGESPKRVGFLPKVLDRTVIAIPLLDEFKAEEVKNPTGARRVFPVVIDLNLDYRKGIAGARKEVLTTIEQIVRERRRDGVKHGLSHGTTEDLQYVFVTLDAEAIKELVRRDTRQVRSKSIERSTASGRTSISSR